MTELGVREEPKAEEERVVHGATEGDARSARRVWVVIGVVSLLALGAAAWVKFGLGDASTAVEEKKPKAPRAVELAEAVRGSMPLLVEYRGELDTDIAELSAQGSGRLLSVKVNLGDVFEEGDVLAKVDAAETTRLLGEAAAQAESAVAAKSRAAAQLEAAKEESERGDRLVAEQIISQQELSALRSQVRVFEAEMSAAEAQRAAALARVSLYREQISQAEIRAPFDGAVARRYLVPGAMVQPGTPILRLVKGGPLDVRFRASELHISRLEPGTPLSVKTLGTGERVFPGKLKRVSAEVSRTDRSVLAEGVLDEEYPDLKPGMYATVDVSLGTLSDAIIVPGPALLSKLKDDGSAERGLYVARAGVAEYVAVEVLGEHEGRAAVGGVKAGDQIVVKGQDVLSDGALVRAAGGKAP